MSSSWRKHRVRFLPLVLISTPFVFACATVPPPTDTVGAARIAIAEATQADAEPHARLELHMAREHLGQAEAAMKNEENEKAREFAEKAGAAAATRNVAQIREDIATLRREIDRASGQNR